MNGAQMIVTFVQPTTELIDKTITNEIDRLTSVEVGRRTLLPLADAESWAQSLGRALRKGGA
jgi:hypothetical protein